MGQAIIPGKNDNFYMKFGTHSLYHEFQINHKKFGDVIIFDDISKKIVFFRKNMCFL